MKEIYTTPKQPNIASKEEINDSILSRVEQVVSDPQQAKRIAGLHMVSDAIRTLDKMQLRKDYHDALNSNGVDFGFIVQGLKNIAESGFKDSDKVKALQVLLKSLGMDKYEKEGAMVGGSWEEVLMKKLDSEPDRAALSAAPIEYEVKVPQIPESMRKQRAEEDAATQGIYGTTSR